MLLIDPLTCWTLYSGERGWMLKVAARSALSQLILRNMMHLVVTKNTHYAAVLGL